ncbi:MAG TPA: hypothetical protein VFS50_16945 [Meiothermus sp.]|jgi:hypothetical protein|nr:hypothetical protein [Meiothermus sp.]
MKVDDRIAVAESRTQPEPQAPPAPAPYEPPRLEEHGTWQHITGVSLPIGSGAGWTGFPNPFDELDRRLGY